MKVKRSLTAASSNPATTPWVRATGSALCAMLVGIGLARFAYGPLMPALIEGGWFPASAVAYLGAANLAGYLAGALIGRPMSTHLRPVTVIRLMLALVTLSFLACAAPATFAWFFVWRFVSGLAGGALMVLAAPVVLPIVPRHRRGLASGLIFTGVGIGIVASATLTPLLVSVGLAETWLAFAVLCLGLSLLAWNGWPAAAAHAMPRAPARGTPRFPSAVRLLFASYGLVAAGLVPHMVFLVDFVARGLGLGLAVGAAIWTLFGVGAVLGPMLAGRIADAIGFGRSLRGALLLLCACNIWLALLPGMTAVAVSSVLVGAFVPGITALALGRIHELMPAQPAARTHAWSRATIAFSVLQALGAYGLSLVFAASAGAYAPLFAIAAAAAGLALLIEATTALSAGRPTTLADDVPPIRSGPQPS